MVAVNPVEANRPSVRADKQSTSQVDGADDPIVSRLIGVVGRDLPFGAIRVDGIPVRLPPLAAPGPAAGPAAGSAAGSAVGRGRRVAC